MLTGRRITQARNLLFTSHYVERCVLGAQVGCSYSLPKISYMKAADFARDVILVLFAACLLET